MSIACDEVPSISLVNRPLPPTSSSRSCMRSPLVEIRDNLERIFRHVMGDGQTAARFMPW